MAKCTDCGNSTGFFSGKTCDTCGAHLCKRCYIHKEGKDYCKNCNSRNGGGCFIATACYGKNSGEVQIFRNWRDNSLLKTRWGRSFVRTYYNVSPLIANFISDKPLLKSMVRAGLFPIKEIVK